MMEKTLFIIAEQAINLEFEARAWNQHLLLFTTHIYWHSQKEDMGVQNCRWNPQRARSQKDIYEYILGSMWHKLILFLIPCK